MKLRGDIKRTSYHVLGVPSFANAQQIRSAYLKRVKVLNAYRFDQTTHPKEWQMVAEVLRELNDAYATLCSVALDRHGISRSKEEGSQLHEVSAA